MSGALIDAGIFNVELQVAGEQVVGTYFIKGLAAAPGLLVAIDVVAGLDV